MSTHIFRWLDDAVDVIDRTRLTVQGELMKGDRS